MLPSEGLTSLMISRNCSTWNMSVSYVSFLFVLQVNLI